MGILLERGDQSHSTQGIVVDAADAAALCSRHAPKPEPPRFRAPPARQLPPQQPFRRQPQDAADACDQSPRSRAPRRPEGALDRPRRHERPRRRDRRGRSRIPDSSTSAPPTAASGSRSTAALTWTPLFDDQQVASIGAVAVFQAQSGHRLGGHRRGQPAQQRLGRQRRLPLARRRRTWTHLGLDSDRAHPPHRPPSHRSRHRLGRRARQAVGREPRARRLQDDRRRQDLEAGALRRRAHRRRRSGRSTRATRTSSSPRCGTTGASPGPSAPAAPAPACYITWDGGETLEAADRGGRPARRATSAASASPSRAPIRTSSTPWSRPKKSALAALRGRRRAAGRRSTTIRATADRPFYFADIAGRPRPGRTASTASTTRAGLERRRQDLRDARPRARHPRRLSRPLDRSAEPRAPRRRQRRRPRHQPRPRRDLALRRRPAARPSSTTSQSTWSVPYNVYGGLQDNGSWRGPADGLGERRHPQPPLAGRRRRRRLRHPCPTRGDSRAASRMRQGGYLLRWDLRTGETQATSSRRRSSRNDPADQAALQLERRPRHRPFDARHALSTAASSSTRSPTAATPGR